MLITPSFPTAVRACLLCFTVFLLVALSACSLVENEDGESDGPLQLRISNSTGADASAANLIHGPISVRLIPATDVSGFEGPDEPVDFGTLEVGTVSDWRTVSSAFRLEVNGQPFGDGPFGVSRQPVPRWQIDIQIKYESGSGFSYGWNQEAQF